jgi:hypothetical protein
MNTAVGGDVLVAALGAGQAVSFDHPPDNVTIDDADAVTSGSGSTIMSVLGLRGRQVAVVHVVDELDDGVEVVSAPSARGVLAGWRRQVRDGCVHRNASLWSFS